MERTGLILLVKVPTRGKNILDMLMAPQIQITMSRLLPLPCDQKAILATVGMPPRDRTKRQTSHTLRRRTPRQHAAMLQALSAFDEADCATDGVSDWDQFYHTTTSWLDMYYPERTVSISSSETDHGRAGPGFLIVLRVMFLPRFLI